ncbi:hypothetical protein VOI54_16030 [Tamlana sp. 2201CG12-4]|uniref:hypothetical protein n=1 Tax=Tamlana sp. 2201CG12-4 TaxID=3112582 RepID=UPI002DB6C285|nr:hypothetical protein [Tamlana sp. 2201CG12-4]MEC3908540.1 hypothetical protein [Tamlana sp. 2201CG12-4]
MIITPTFIILIGIVFILTWLFVKTIDKRKWLTILVSLALTPIAYFYVVYPILNIFSSYHHEKRFNPETWQSKPELRFEMLNHIITTDSLFTGKPKHDIELLLGKPEWYGWDDHRKVNSQDLWNYNLGFKPGAFNTMQECIELNFENNIVTTLRTYQLEKPLE